MKKDWAKHLGFLLGALVLGTAFPHLLKNRDFELPWKSVLYITSIVACFRWIDDVICLLAMVHIEKDREVLDGMRLEKYSVQKNGDSRHSVILDTCGRSILSGAFFH